MTDEARERIAAGRGRLVGIGVGPGDPELITLKGVRLLQESDVVMTPVGDRSDVSIAYSVIAGHIDPERQQVLSRIFPMRQPAAQMARAWRDIAAEIAGFVRAGQRVAFVTLGDPMLYSTFLYLRFELQNGYPEIPVSSVPGISSIQAAAGRANVPLGLGDDILTVVPATADDERLRAACEATGTVVLLKVYRAFDRVRSLLRELGLLQCAVFVRRLGLDGEKIISDLDAVEPDDLDYLSLILVRQEVGHG